MHNGKRGTEHSETGIYSYKLDITDISGAWGGNMTSPAFSVVLLTDEQLVACQEALDFRQASMSEPEYQIGAFGNMKMSSVASFPADLQYAAPVIPTCNDLKYIAGTMTEWNHKALTDNSFTFTADSDTEFTFTNGVWGFTARGATIYALNEEIVLSENSDANITFIDGVLTVGNEYTITLIVKDKHEAYVKVTEAVTD